MRPPSHSLADRRRALVALVVVVLATLLDRGRGDRAQHAALFYFVVQALIIAGQAIESAGVFIAIHLEAAVTWIFAHLIWLGGYVGNILKSTGAMFSRVWDGMRAFYGDVLKPLAEHLYEWYNRVKDWLKKYLGPVYDFLKRVRTELLAAYKRFVRPFLDIIDVARGFLRILGDLGVEWAKALDQRLGQFESIITENFLKILGPLNRVIDVVNSIVTGDLLLQRFPFLSTLRRDIHYVNAALLQARLDFRTTPTPGLRGAKKLPRTPTDQYARDLARFYESGDGVFADEIDNLVIVWKQAVDVNDGTAS